jgi:hypothetical protein
MNRKELKIEVYMGGNIGIGVERRIDAGEREEMGISLDVVRMDGRGLMKWNNVHWRAMILS